MLSRRHLMSAALGLPTLLVASQAEALYFVEQMGTTPVGREQAEKRGWPEGALEVADHPLRAQGWHPFFSECPNDIYHFGYRLVDTREANRLLQALQGFVKEKPTLLVLAEPEFRWDKDAKEGYQATFRLGSQSILDEWWQQLPGGKFGVTVYKEPPKAQPPQVTLYVGGGKIDLQQLRIPAGVKVGVPQEADLRKGGVAEGLIEKLRIFAAAHADRKP